MKHLFNDIPQSEKQRILEMHGVKSNIISEQYTYSSFRTGDVVTLKKPSDMSTRTLTVAGVTSSSITFNIHGTTYTGTLVSPYAIKIGMSLFNILIQAVKAIVSRSIFFFKNH